MDVDEPSKSPHPMSFQSIAPPVGVDGLREPDRHPIPPTPQAPTGPDLGEPSRIDVGESTRPESSEGRPLNVTDALSYLDAVKVQFADKPEVYNRFLDIMKDFKSQVINTPGVIRRVSELFHGNPNLIEGFNTFLPNGYRIELSAEPNTITVTTPQGKENLRTNRQLPPPTVHPSLPPRDHQTHTAVSVLGNMTGSGPHAREAPVHDAIQFLNKIKHRFCNDEDIHIYKKFLDILQQIYHENQARGVQREVHEVSPHILQQVQLLFKDAPDLLAEFQDFLPGSGLGPLHPVAPSPTWLSPNAQTNDAANWSGRSGSPWTSASAGPSWLGDAVWNEKGIKRTKGSGLSRSSSQVGGSLSKEPSFSKSVGPSKSSMPASHPAKSISQSAAPKRAKKRPLEKEVTPVTAAPTKPPAVKNKRAKHHHKADNDSLYGDSPAARSPAMPPPPPPVIIPPYPNGNFPANFLPGQMYPPNGFPPGGNLPNVFGAMRVGGVYASAYGFSPLPSGNEFSFFDRVKAHFIRKDKGMRKDTDKRDKDQRHDSPGPSMYDQFLRLLSLFSKDIISPRALIDQVEVIFADAEDLVADFKDLLLGDKMERLVRHANLNASIHGGGNIVRGGIQERQPVAAGGELIGPPGSLRMQASEALLSRPADDSGGPSYRKLPQSEIHLACSGRDEHCRSLLNDGWISHPAWASEEYGFQGHKKNSFEDALHKSEEERHEYQVYIEGIRRTIALLDPLAARIEEMSPDERASFQMFNADISPEDATNKIVPHNNRHLSDALGGDYFGMQDFFGGSARGVYVRTLRKLYGSATAEIIQGLKENPCVAIPVVLARLKSKDEEWRKAQREWSRTWKEVDAKNFYKAIDHQGVNFKQTDKKAITVKSFIGDVETRRKSMIEGRRTHIVEGHAHKRRSRALAQEKASRPKLNGRSTTTPKTGFVLPYRTNGKSALIPHMPDEPVSKPIEPAFNIPSSAYMFTLGSVGFQIEYLFDDMCVLCDAMRLVYTYLDHTQTQYSAAERKAIEDFLRTFVPVFCGLNAAEFNFACDPLQQYDLASTGPADDVTVNGDGPGTSRPNVGQEAGTSSKSRAVDPGSSNAHRAASQKADSGVVPSDLRQKLLRAMIERSDSLHERATASHTQSKRSSRKASATVSTASVSRAASPEMICSRKGKGKARDVALDGMPEVDVWINEPSADSSLQDNIAFTEDDEDRPFFCNTTFYTLLRLLQLLYVRLHESKETGKTLAREHYSSLLANPVAVKLGLDDPNGPPALLQQVLDTLTGRAQRAYIMEQKCNGSLTSSLGIATDSTNDVQNGVGISSSRLNNETAARPEDTNVLYMYLLDACTKVFENELDQPTFEEHMRWFFGHKAYRLFTFDKLIAALVKQVQTVLSDLRCHELWSLLQIVRGFPDPDAEDERDDTSDAPGPIEGAEVTSAVASPAPPGPHKAALTIQDIIRYRREAERYVSSDEHLYRIVWSRKAQTLQIQLMGGEDPSVDAINIYGSAMPWRPDDTLAALSSDASTGAAKIADEGSTGIFSAVNGAHAMNGTAVTIGIPLTNGSANGVLGSGGIVDGAANTSSRRASEERMVTHNPTTAHLVGRTPDLAWPIVVEKEFSSVPDTSMTTPSSASISNACSTSGVASAADRASCAAVARWREYVNSYVTRHRTEWLPSAAAHSSNSVLGPPSAGSSEFLPVFLRRCLDRPEHEENDGRVEVHDGMSVRVSLPRYRLMYAAGAEDVLVRRRPRQEEQMLQVRAAARMDERERCRLLV